MIEFFVVDDYGHITMTGQCEETELHLYSYLGRVVHGSAEIGLQYYQEDSLVEISEPPSDVHSFCVETKQWILSWEKVRDKRDQLLNSCDWCVLPDSPITNKGDWLAYRQQLRDIPEDSLFDGKSWPSPPSM